MEPSIQAQIQQYDSCLQQWCAGYEDYAKSVGLSYTSLSILNAIYDLPDCTQKQLCQVCFLPKQTVNTVVKELQRQGYVRLEAGKDQKEKRIFFTDSGLAYAQERLGPLFELEDRALEAIGSQAAQAVVTGQLAFTAAFEREVHRGT